MVPPWGRFGAATALATSPNALRSCSRRQPSLFTSNESAALAGWV